MLELTLAVLVSTVPVVAVLLTVRTKVKVIVPPAGRVPPTGGPVSCTNETRVVCKGRASLTLTLWAASGPLLVTVIG